MGIEIYFFKQKRLEGQAKETCNKLETKYEKLGKEIDRLEDLGNNDTLLNKLYEEKEKYSLEVKKITEFTKVAYFWKVNFLVDFFDYEENLSCITITKEKIELLIKKCKKVLENNELAKDLLPTVSGFFFGSLKYDEDYFESVADVLHEFEKILSDTDFDTHEIIMWCWW